MPTLAAPDSFFHGMLRHLPVNAIALTGRAVLVSTSKDFDLIEAIHDTDAQVTYSVFDSPHRKRG